MTSPVNTLALVQSVQPAVQIENGQAITTSVEIARVFDKEHRHVLDAIRKLVADMPENRLPNFRQTVETRPNPIGGAPIKSPAYHLTRDGFFLLAFGFTGKKATAFKLAYIDAFNKMESALQEKARLEQKQALLASATLTLGEQYEVTNWVSSKCRGWGEWCDKAKREVHAALAQAFGIPHYCELPRTQLQAARDWIDAYTIVHPQPRRNADVTWGALDDYTYALSHLQHEILRQIGTKLLTRPDDCKAARWLVSFADDDRGKALVPRVQALDASATMVQIISAGAGA